MRVTTTWRNDNPNTIWNVLARKLGREPTNDEAKAEVQRTFQIVFGLSPSARADMSNETKRRLLLSKWNGFDRVGDMREQLDAKDEIIDDLRYEIELMESALVDVKYWMQAAQFRRSWPLLRKVEDALGS